ncbi:12816_t:CDS:2 [Ambispora gerdemannii]|uniref:Small ribosomal subunit protein bS18m n=1 Tax=Ambispora gerdemannii TaxID=144530 RepID=A0A9N8VWZ2_9GLOM|nr:12816_t:CDS:2 [Ambispora gerdemannii]
MRTRLFATTLTTTQKFITPFRLRQNLSSLATLRATTSNTNLNANSISFTQHYSCVLKTQRKFLQSSRWAKGEVVEEDSSDKPPGTDTHEKIINILRASSAINRQPGGIAGQPENRSRFVKAFQPGQIYKPSDLSENVNVQRRRYLEKPKPTVDVFNALGINPLKEYKNYNLLSSFVSDMGKILPRSQTGITAKNQRRLAKAIKRARSFGLIPSTHRRPNEEISLYTKPASRNTPERKGLFEFDMRK